MAVDYVRLPHLAYYNIVHVKANKDGDISVLLTGEMPDLPDIKISTSFMRVRTGIIKSIEASCLSSDRKLSNEAERRLGIECMEIAQIIDKSRG